MKKKICILIGRKIIHNLTRELTLVKEFAKFDLDCIFLIPGKNVSHSYYNIDDLNHFSDVNYIFINNFFEFEEISKKYDYFLIASWRDYEQFVNILKKNKKKFIVYSESGGIDFWDLGAKNIFFKSLANVYVYSRARRNFIINAYRAYLSNKGKITGSLRYQYYKSLTLKNNKNIQIVFFPKSFSNFENKLRIIVKNKPENWYINYMKNMRTNYSTIYELIKNAGFKITVRLHYAINDKHHSVDAGKSDFDFWNNLGVEIFDGDERELLKNMDIGIGVESHTSIDVNLHNKPYIFFKSSLTTKPKYKGFDLAKLFGKKFRGCHGFSSKFGINKSSYSDLWLPYWYGCYANEHNLVDCINHIYENVDKIKDRKFLDRINKFYWGDYYDKNPSSIIAKETYNLLFS